MITNSYNARRAQEARIARAHLIEKIADALQPSTLDAILSDLSEHCQDAAGDQEMVDAAATIFADWLAAKTGEDHRYYPRENDLDIAARECAKEAAQVNA